MANGKHKKFISNIVKSAGAGLAVLLCAVLARFAGAAVAASLAASSFIAFAFPDADSSRARFLVGGYVCGIVSGLAVGLLRPYAHGALFGLALPALAVFVCSLMMLAFSLQHPPSAAIALTLLYDANPVLTSLVAFGGIMIVCLTRMAFVKFNNALQCDTILQKKTGGKTNAGIHSPYAAAERGGDAVRRAEEAAGIRLGRKADPS